MKPPGRFDPAQLRALAAALERGYPLHCPVCSARLDEWPVPPRPDVSYVRDRLLLVCSSCGRSATLDRPRRP
ncbi:MAG TPA: hypothetical protein VFQ22_03150 [Longimicrobiales bacterium]|nr:hypothetical protein [Longimicrobiales bacterium]